MQTSLTTKILTVGFLGLLLAWGSGMAGIARASEVTGTLSTTMASSDTANGQIAGNVVGGRAETTSSSGGGTCTGTCTLPSNGGPAFLATGGGSGVAYTAIPISTIGAPAAGGPIAYDSGIAYSSYPDYSGSNASGSANGSGMSGSDDSSSASTSTLPGAPSTGGTLSPGESLMAASVQNGGMSTAAAIAIAILGLAILGGAAYGINSAYRRNRGL